MTLKALMQKGGLSNVANANPAKAANHVADEAGTLARLATLALPGHKPAANYNADMLPDPTAAARQQRGELTRLMHEYASHNGFSQVDYEEAIGVALKNVEGWLIYLRTQPECKTVQ